MRVPFAVVACVEEPSSSRSRAAPSFRRRFAAYRFFSCGAEVVLPLASRYRVNRWIAIRERMPCRPKKP
jgi:hypothetical protein